MKKVLLVILFNCSISVFAQSNLPYKRATGFIYKLTQSNLINEVLVKNKKVFIITERGKLYLDEYKQFSHIAESFGLEL